MGKLLEEGNNGRPFYAATRKLAAATPTQPWKVTDLFVGMGPKEVCREVLSFFGTLAMTEAEGVPDIPRVNGGLSWLRERLNCYARQKNGLPGGRRPSPPPG